MIQMDEGVAPLNFVLRSICCREVCDSLHGASSKAIRGRKAARCQLQLQWRGPRSLNFFLPSLILFVLGPLQFVMGSKESRELPSAFNPGTIVSPPRELDHVSGLQYSSCFRSANSDARADSNRGSLWRNTSLKFGQVSLLHSLDMAFKMAWRLASTTEFSTFTIYEDTSSPLYIYIVKAICAAAAS
jgi:hypothetical protein